MSYSCIISVRHTDGTGVPDTVWSDDDDVYIPSAYKHAVGNFVTEREDDATGSRDLSPYRLSSLYALVCALSALRPLRHELCTDLFDGSAAFTTSPGYYKIDAGKLDENGMSVPNAPEDVEIMQKAIWWTANLLLGGVFDTEDMDSLFFDHNDQAREGLHKILRLLDTRSDCKAVAYIG